MKKIYILYISSLIIFGQQALAKNSSGLFVEPGLSYEVSDSEINWPSPFGNNSGKINGFGLFGRVGFHVNEVFFVAADARFKKVKIDADNNNYNANAEGFDIAPVIGVQMPNYGLRLWGGYVIAGELNPETDQGINAKFKEAQGYRVGAGLRLKSFSINIEFQDLTYGKSEVESFGPFNSNTSFGDVELENQSYILSVSFPLEI